MPEIRAEFPLSHERPSGQMGKLIDDALMTMLPSVKQSLIQAITKSVVENDGWVSLDSNLLKQNFNHAIDASGVFDLNDSYALDAEEYCRLSAVFRRYGLDGNQLCDTSSDELRAIDEEISLLLRQHCLRKL